MSLVADCASQQQEQTNSAIHCGGQDVQEQLDVALVYILKRVFVY